MNKFSFVQVLTYCEVDMEIRSRMNKFKTSYDYEKEDTIRRIAKERYGKSEKK